MAAVASTAKRPALEEDEGDGSHDQQRQRLTERRMETAQIDKEHQHGDRQTGDDEAHDQIADVGAPESRVPEAKREIPVSEVHQNIRNEVGNDRGHDVPHAEFEERSKGE